MHEPPTPASGHDLLPWAKRLVDYLRECRVQAGPGLRLRRTSSGTLLTPAPTAHTPQKPIPLHLTTSRPSYIPEPTTPTPADTQRIWITWGGINNAVAANWDAPLELSEDTLIYANITLNQYSHSNLITSWELASGSTVPENPEWPESGPTEPLRPAKHYLLLGSYFHASRSVHNEGAGSIVMAEYAHDIGGYYNTLGTYLKKSISFARVNY